MIGRIGRFIAVMYKPHYALYGLLWVLALEGTAAVVSGATPWRPTVHTAVRIGVVLAVLLYLRMVDEQKDLEYDRVNNPDRPLVTGAVTATDLRISMAVIAIGTAIASFALSVGSGVLLLATLAYGLFLWGAEAASATVRTHIMLNLLITYPVQLILTGYVLLSAVDTGEVNATWRAAATAIVFAGAFLQFEFARKTSKAHSPGELLYSNALGPTGSACAVGIFATIAVVAELLLVGPSSFVTWLPILALPIAWSGVAQFLRTPRETFPLAPAVVFILALYGLLIAQAAAVDST